MKTEPFFINLAHRVYVVNSKAAALEAYNSMWDGREGVTLEQFTLPVVPCLVVFDDDGHIEIIDTAAIDFAMATVQKHTTTRTPDADL